MTKSLKEYDWDEIRDALMAYADYLQEADPYAVNAICHLRNAAESTPDAEEFD